jgi:hypothetical protein
MDVETTLKQAVSAANAGRKEEARRLLEAVLDADDHNEQAWLWMGGVVDRDEERIICLENVLTINPNNEPARKGLAALRADPVPLPVPEVEGEAVPAAPPVTSHTEPHVPDVPSDYSSTSDRRPFIIITIVLVLMLICTVVGILAFVLLSPVG